MSIVVDNKDIIEFLREKPRRYKEFKPTLGKYPRKKLHLMLEAGSVSKDIVDGRILWTLVEDDEELPRALDVSDELKEKSEEAKNIFKRWFSRG